MAMISPICLENLVEMGKWMGLAEDYMEQAIQAPEPVVPGLPAVVHPWKGLASYNLTEVEGARKRMMEYCPQRAGADEIGTLFDLPQVHFHELIDSIQEQWADDNLIVALRQMKNLEQILMEWVDDIAFFEEPSRHTKAGVA